MNRSARQLLLARVEDERRKRVIFVSHCLLNENTRYLGGASRPGCLSEGEGLFVATMRRRLMHRHLIIRWYEHDLLREIRGQPIDLRTKKE